MPAGIQSPGYDAEQVGKPAVTKKLEDGDKVISPEACAGHLIRGVSFTSIMKTRPYMAVGPAPRNAQRINCPDFPLRWFP